MSFSLPVFAALLVMLVGGDAFAVVILSHLESPSNEPSATGVIIQDQPIVVGTTDLGVTGFYDDGGVEMNDLDTWLTNWHLRSQTEPFATIPEPTSAAVLGVIGVAGVCRRRR